MQVIESDDQLVGLLNFKVMYFSIAGAKRAQLHQGGGGLRLPREPGVVLLPDGGVSPPERPPHQPRGQAADQEHPVPRRQGLRLRAGGGRAAQQHRH